jgi:uncharacterized protein DUF3604
MRQIVRLSGDRRGHNDKDPALTMDRAGRLWVAWQSYVPQADCILARSVVGGEASELFVVSDEAGTHFQPAIAASGEDAVWVLWSAKRGAHWHILARAIAAGKMGPVVRLSENTGIEYSPCAAGASGRIWSAWTSVRDGRHQIAGRVVADGNGSASVLLSKGPGEHFRPVVCADPEGAWVAYETLLHGTYELRLCRWTPSGLTPPVRFSLTDASEMHPSLCADGAGGVWAAWIATRDVQDNRGVVDHKVEIMASHLSGDRWTPYRSPDRSKPDGYVTHLYDGLLGRKSYWGFVGHRRRPQLVREENGDVWVLYERKEDESINRRGPDALFYGKPLTGRGRHRTYQVDQDVYAYTVNSGLPVVSGQLVCAGQIPSGDDYGDICAGTLFLDRTHPVRPRPASDWKSWQPILLPACDPAAPRPTMRVGDKTYHLYWGDTHCHSTCSGDAEGEVDECYAYGRHRAGLDFMAVTDNDFIYDDTLTPAAWALLRAEAGHWNDPGQFVTLSGYERSFREPPVDGPGINHRIILFADDEQPVCRFTEPDADTLTKFVRQMEGADAYEYPHHATWWLAPCSRLGGAEVCSSWDVYIDKAQTIAQALRGGYRLAFIGSSDTHRIVPGLGGALTGVWAEALTRKDILAALRARRCFATNGERTVLDVRVECALMGSEQSVADRVVVQCQVRAPRAIRSVDLFRNGEQVLRHDVNKPQAMVALEDSPGAGTYAYHVRVCLARLPRAPLPGRPGNLQTARGEFAWSSPIWVQVRGDRQDACDTAAGAAPIYEAADVLSVP